MTIEFDDTYTGKRFTYGLSFRPIESCNLPPDWIINSDQEHTDFNFGTVDFCRHLSDDETQSFQLMRVNKPEKIK